MESMWMLDKKARSAFSQLSYKNNKNDFICSMDENQALGIWHQSYYIQGDIINYTIK
jgi:hypothetical protein